ncbi:hypothetical protein [Sciscionella sediminilitoris]|uniref:hypothetical protein n=1 Tax=Sciscionella sediminilitoris TaxID=1445613 RepID=UPI0004DF23CA|nr:hypothetical protein [Sciscionella sp. SE31]
MDDLRLLRIAALAELISLALLLANLVTIHLPAISSLTGPVHGCCYLFAIGVCWRHPRASSTDKGIVLLPAAGGLLVLRRLGRPAGTSG